MGLQGFHYSDGEALLAAVDKYHPKSIFLLTGHFVHLSACDIDSSKEAVRNVLSIVPAASAIPLQCEVDVRRKFPNVKSVPCIYGSSETGIYTYSDTNVHLGHLMSNAEAKVCNKCFMACIPSTPLCVSISRRWLIWWKETEWVQIKKARYASRRTP